MIVILTSNTIIVILSNDTYTHNSSTTVTRCAGQINTRMRDAEDTERAINAAREVYRTVPIRGSILYFVIADLVRTVLPLLFVFAAVLPIWGSILHFCDCRPGALCASVLLHCVSEGGVGSVALDE